MKDQYDLVVIGGGSAGLTGAAFAAQLGRSVAIVEKNRIGGDCTWTGCVPSKTLLKAARVAHQMRSADTFGLGTVEPQVDFKRIMAHVREVVNEVYRQESPDTIRTDGIDIFPAAASFLDPHTIAAGEAVLTARRILLATGARPFIPPVPGLDSVKYLTYENVWDLESLPKHLMVIGGGPVGCEMAQAFRRLGSQVTIVDAADRLLPQDEPEASGVLAEKFVQEGIDVRLNSAVQGARQDGDAIYIAAGGKELMGDVLLLAVGRRPNVAGVELDRAGVIYSELGIQVNVHLRTTQQHIYAAGDCTGGYQFTHYAGWQAFMAARNALLPGTSNGIPDHVPWTTFTDPEVAHVGLSESEAVEKLGDTVMTCYWPMERVDRALAEGETDGFIKLVHTKNGNVLGATIVAARAGEMIQEWTIALDQRMKVGDVARSIHVYPTYSMASMQAAADIRVGQLLGGTSGRVIRGLSRLMR